MYVHRYDPSTNISHLDGARIIIPLYNYIYTRWENTTVIIDKIVGEIQPGENIITI